MFYLRSIKLEKKLVIVFLITLILSGCNITNDKKNPVIKTELSNSRQSSSQSTEQSITKIEAYQKTGSIYQTIEQLEQIKKNITVEDQEQVEQLIKAYFTALEKKDYAVAWELTSSEKKKIYSKEDALKSHWGLDSIKFISLKGYYPSKYSAVGDVPTNTPTIWFTATIEIEPSPNTAWNKGLNGRFVNVVKDIEGKWRIDGLATGP